MSFLIMKDQTSVFLVFEGFGSNPNTVTELVGISPTRSHGKGEIIQRAGRDFVAPRASWILNSPRSKSDPAEDLIEALLDLLEPHADGVRQAAEQYPSGIVIGRTSEAHRFGFNLTPTAIQRIAALNLGVDTDIYLFSNVR